MMRPFATLLLALSGIGTALAAGGTYDEEDPFDERERIAEFKARGGDLTGEVKIEFQFSFEDRPETRTEHAQRFALKLRRMGYPDAEAFACPDPTDCWFVVAPARMRIDEKKLIALSKELDQLAADDYGRYQGWDHPKLRPDWPVGRLLEDYEKLVLLQCSEPDTERKREEQNKWPNMWELMCTCTPERARELRTRMSPEQRAAPISEELFAKAYTTMITSHCAAKMMRKMYGEDCPQLPEAKDAGEGYCPCMRALVESIPDAMLGFIGMDREDWVPRAAAAKKAGQSEPERPPLLGPFMARELACRQ